MKEVYTYMMLEIFEKLMKMSILLEKLKLLGQLGAIEVARPILGETEAFGLVLGETEVVGPLYEDTNVVGPVLGERDNEVNVAESDEDDDSELEDFSAEGWLSNKDDEEISQIFDNKRKIKSGNLGDEHQEAQPKHIATDSQRKESSVEDESSDTDYIESNDSSSYKIDYEGEFCVKKCKKLFFNDKGEVPEIELGDFKGEILAVVGRDGNNQIFHVVWVIVTMENRETWVWFLEHIQTDLEIGDEDRFTILSDMQKVN
ncbi:hypothetical protein V6N11_068041 [Hibiscus sabdariffa]|uniref:MULE transposase domain-containing protein n=1 Tax=Hibiscus sabdariffa TaxID=183260 RepID=A0ABR2SSI3_9ROSI